MTLKDVVNRSDDGPIEVVMGELPDQRQRPESRWVIHLIFLMAAIGVLAMSFLMKLVGANAVFLPGATVPLPESCTTRIFFGINCPGCGLTRSFILLSRGEFVASLRFNPAGFLVYIFVWLQIPWQAFQIWRLKRGLSPFEHKYIYAVPIVVAVAVGVQWLVRLVFFR